jgi:hypothetical protein
MTLQLRRSTHLGTSSMREAMLHYEPASLWQLPTTPTRSCQLYPTCRHHFTLASTYTPTAHVQHSETFSSATYSTPPRLLQLHTAYIVRSAASYSLPLPAHRPLHGPSRPLIPNTIIPWQRPNPQQVHHGSLHSPAGSHSLVVVVVLLFVVRVLRLPARVYLLFLSPLSFLFLPPTSHNHTLW